MGEDWHAICQAFYKGIEEEEWDVDIGKAVNLRQPSTSRKARTLWKVTEATMKGEEYYDQGSARRIESRVAVKQAMWEKHLQSPVSVLDEALRRTAAGGERAGSSAAGRSAV